MHRYKNWSDNLITFIYLRFFTSVSDTQKAHLHFIAALYVMTLSHFDLCSELKTEYIIQNEPLSNY